MVRTFEAEGILTMRRVSRRQALVGGLGGLASLAGLPRRAAALGLETHALAFYHQHTGERLEVVYRDHGELVPDALDAIDTLLRDFRTGEKQRIDVDLLDTLATLYAEFDRRGRFEIISAYRSPRTNEALRKATSGVAKDSWHLHGRAIDVRLTSARTANLRDAAISLGRGGVGFYPDSNFVHLDTGPVRTW